MGTHEEGDAAGIFWVRRTTAAAQWRDFAYQRLAYVNYPEVYLNTARIWYLGDLPASTVQQFEGP